MKENLEKVIENIVCCPNCKVSLEKDKNQFYCSLCGVTFILKGHYLYDNNLILQSQDNYSRERWNKIYDQRNSNQKKIRENYLEQEFPTLLQQIEAYHSIDGVTYLEIGCGEMYFGQAIAKKCHFVIGADYSPKALQTAEYFLEKKNITNYLLILADIRNLPLKENSIDLVFGGGVIEHFRDTQNCINEIFRVLKPGGVSFNTVPALNMGSLTYRQLWGNIPNLPILRSIYEFIHFKLLQAKHLRYGYELSFFKNTLKKLHLKAGFKKVVVNRYQVRLIFEFIPKPLRPLLLILTHQTSLFWPMHKVIAVK